MTLPTYATLDGKLAASVAKRLAMIDSDATGRVQRRTDARAFR